MLCLIFIGKNVTYNNEIEWERASDECSPFAYPSSKAALLFLLVLLRVSREKHIPQFHRSSKNASFLNLSGTRSLPLWSAPNTIDPFLSPSLCDWIGGACKRNLMHANSPLWIWRVVASRRYASFRHFQGSYSLLYCLYRYSFMLPRIRSKSRVP